MTRFDLPVLPVHRATVTVAGVALIWRYVWNNRQGAYYVDLSFSDGTPILTGALLEAGGLLGGGGLVERLGLPCYFYVAAAGLGGIRVFGVTATELRALATSTATALRVEV